ncbi:hypothetical protein AGMMS49949_07270 [Alphaproteobacteria bacterium]|nr:hypothetical protein AGMMS49949_07270 [Alphaproteobacteria bacterium]GHS98755.1 hypothetical protein AGMMS50296_6620 [Alphaproteobacteria bacterium]
MGSSRQAVEDFRLFDLADGNRRKEVTLTQEIASIWKEQTESVARNYVRSRKSAEKTHKDTPHFVKIFNVRSNGDKHTEVGLVEDGGSLYVGELENGLAEGKGTKTGPDSKYVGDLVTGKMEGQGVYTFADGRVYAGQFKAEKREGKGMYTWPSGAKFVHV